MKVGFIVRQCGRSVGGQLATQRCRFGGSRFEQGYRPTVANPGRGLGESPKDMGEQCQVVITCLPSPAVQPFWKQMMVFWLALPPAAVRARFGRDEHHDRSGVKRIGER